MIHESRIRVIRGGPTHKGRYVLYWMQASPRVACNHALAYAIDRAAERDVPLLVYFGLTEHYPMANARHMTFLIEGLLDTQRLLAARGIPLIIRHESPLAGALALSSAACLTVVDRGALRIQRHWYRHLADRITCPTIQVETNVVVPIEVASNKEEYAARTLRPKIERLLPGYLVPLAERAPHIDATGIDIDSLDVSDVQETVARLAIDRSVAPVASFRGGESRAQSLLERFVATKLDRYAEDRNDPTRDGLSQLSPYLHFGQISPLDIALRVREADSPGSSAYLEELIVRRELAINMVYYNPRYDVYEDIVPAWALSRLAEEADAPRPYLYTRDEFERAETHDPYWNAAQNEMRFTGKMHGYMRMYWGKKIIEWSATPREAFETAIHLNDTYSLDGRDPNGYAGVAWCFGKHDRPWKRRPIFGSVRYMNARGLERKFDAKRYVKIMDEQRKEVEL